MFSIRVYAKQELAMLYFPDATPHAAVNRLGRWISRNRGLQSAFRRLHTHKAAKFYTSAEVSKIVQYLGPPEIAYDER